MNKFIKFSLVAIFAIFVSACSAMREPIESPSGLVPQALTLDEVKKGITLALGNRGWVVTSANNQVIKARITVRTHYAEIEIPYNEESYEIKYVSSRNLKDQADGSIHNKYNHWARNLQLDINNTLSQLVATQH